MKHLLLTISLTCFISFSVASQSVQSDSLFAKGVQLYNAGQYEEAIPCFLRCDSLDWLTIRNSARSQYCIAWIASSYYKLGDIKSAEKLNPNYMVNPIDRRLTIKSDSLLDVAYNNLNMGYFDKAYQQLQSALSLLSELYPGHLMISNIYRVLADICEKSNRFDEAIDYYQKSMTLRWENLKFYDNTFFDMNRAVGVLYCNIGNEEMAINTFKDAESLIDNNSSSIKDVLNTKSLFYSNFFLLLTRLHKKIKH